MAPASPVLPLTDQENISCIYAVLPPLLKNSMPKVPSLRRSLSGYNDRAAALVGHVRALSTESFRPGSATPPPPYQEPIASLTSVLSEIDFQETPPTSPRSLPVDSHIFVNDERAGIKWEFARQGNSQHLQHTCCLPSHDMFLRLESSPEFIMSFFQPRLQSSAVHRRCQLSTSRSAAESFRGRDTTTSSCHAI